MTKKNIDELTNEEQERLQQLKERDSISDLIVMNMIENNSEIDFDVVEAIEQKSFEKQDYYVAAEVLFHTGAPAEWINLVLKVIEERNPDEIVNFIREIVYAYNNNLNVEVISQYINRCETPVELRAFSDDIIHRIESNAKVRETIEQIPELIEKIEVDSLEAKQSYIDMKERLVKKEQEIDELKKQLEALKRCEDENNISEEQYEKTVKKAEYFEKKFKESQKALRNYKDECIHLSSKIEELEDRLRDKDPESNNFITEELKEFFDKKLQSSVDNLAKIMSSSYGKVLNAIENNKPELSNTNDSEELKKMISQQEDIINKLQNFSAETIPIKNDAKKETEFIETHEFENDVGDIEIIADAPSESEMYGEFGGIPEDIQYEEPDTDKNENDLVPEYKEPELEESSVYTINEAENERLEEDAVGVEAVKEQHQEPDINLCKAPELLNGKILSSKAKDDKEEKKIGFFARMKFKYAKDKKQKQLILDLMLRKRIPIQTVNAVKEIINSGKVDNNFVFELINDERATEETILSALEFVR